MGVESRLILVVDPDAESRALLANTLSLDGHEVDTASDREQALLLLSQRHYDLVVSDLRMPTLEGPALYQALSQQYGARIPPVIFTTAYAFEPEYFAFLADTLSPVLIKPLSPVRILQLAERMLRA